MAVSTAQELSQEPMIGDEPFRSPLSNPRPVKLQCYVSYKTTIKGQRHPTGGLTADTVWGPLQSGSGDIAKHDVDRIAGA
jgi:hypothetical protein